jgi:hypothetical protein
LAAYAAPTTRSRTLTDAASAAVLPDSMSSRSLMAIRLVRFALVLRVWSSVTEAVSPPLACRALATAA